MTTFNFGDISVTRIEESLGPLFNADTFLPDFDMAAVEPHMDWFAPNHFDPQSGSLVMSMHSWLIRTPQHTILVDTCVGNHKDIPRAPSLHMQDFPWMDNLAAAGVQPEDIDFVMCTHLHMDHVGWNTRLEDGRHVPTFPNARYLFSKTDHEIMAATMAGDEPDALYRDKVLPVIEAGLGELVEGEHSVGDNLIIRPAPGHTPGHVSISLSNGDEKGLFIGDALHSAIQGVFPDWNSAFCQLPDEARSTRRQLLEHCCEHNALLMPQHFGIPFATKVRPQGDAFAFDFMP